MSDPVIDGAEAAARLSRADRNSLAELMRRYQPVIDAAQAWRTGHAADGSAVSKHDAVEQLLAASEAVDALGDAGQVPTAEPTENEGDSDGQR